MDRSKCLMCGGHKEASTITERLRVKHDNRVVEFEAIDLPVLECQKCHSVSVAPNYDSVVRHQLRSAVGLLQPGRIKQLRERAGLTQAELSEETGIAVATLSRIENDKQVQSVSTDKHLRRTFDALTLDQSVQRVLERVQSKSGLYGQIILDSGKAEVENSEQEICEEFCVAEPEYAIAA